MKIAVHSSSPTIERVVAWALGKKAVALTRFAETMTNDTLARFPADKWCASQEANLFVLARLDHVRWQETIKREAARIGGDPAVLDRLARQAFVLRCGRDMARLREMLEMPPFDTGPVAIACALPPDIMSAFIGEYGGRVKTHVTASLVLRLTAALSRIAQTTARHLARAADLLATMRLPRLSGDRRPYVAWLAALPAEVAGDGNERMGLTGFLSEAISDRPLEVVIQGARPADLPPGMLHRPRLPALRTRPRLAALVYALALQLTLALVGLIRAADWRRREIIQQLLYDAPGFLLWFSEDPPEAVLYTNAMVGSEPPCCLLSRRFGVPSVMVLYSANYAYHVPPAAFCGPSTPLEPEIRCIAADRVTMWSERMRAAFEEAGHATPRLPVTGPLHFARQNGFHPLRHRGGDRNGPVRIGIFDVSIQTAPRRFMVGWGETFFSRDFSDRFFRDILDACRSRFGDEFVIVRKLKRALGAQHDADIAFDAFGPFQLDPADPAANLWRLLERLDAVLCMPFTSVAFIAAAVGVPAAYYDPSGLARPSPLGGDAPLLSDRAALDRWLDERPLPGGNTANVCYAPAVIDAALAARRELVAAIPRGTDHA